jgi:hypothetical protein
MTGSATLSPRIVDRHRDHRDGDQERLDHPHPTGVTDTGIIDLLRLLRRADLNHPIALADVMQIPDPLPEISSRQRRSGVPIRPFPTDYTTRRDLQGCPVTPRPRPRLASDRAPVCASPARATRQRVFRQTDRQGAVPSTKSSVQVSNDRCELRVAGCIEGAAVAVERALTQPGRQGPQRRGPTQRQPAAERP